MALTKDAYLKTRKVEVKESEALLRFSGGDARKLLNVLEPVINADENEETVITNDLVIDRLQE